VEFLGFLILSLRSICLPNLRTYGIINKNPNSKVLFSFRNLVSGATDFKAYWLSCSELYYYLRSMS